jgi:integrase
MGIKEQITRFEDYLMHTTTLARSSRIKYAKIVRRFLMMNGLKFTINDINKFITENNMGTKRCYNYKYALLHFLTCIGMKGKIDGVVGVKIKPRIKQFKYVDKETITRIINMLANPYKKIAFLQLKTGGRFREIATLEIQNIDYNIHPELIYLSVAEYAKGQKKRTLRLSKKYEKYLKRWSDGKTFGWLFLPKTISKFNENKLDHCLDNMLHIYNDMLLKLGSSNGIDKLASHYLRHIFSDYFLQAGGDIYTLHMILGHSKIETTIPYLSIGDKAADRVFLHMEGG